VLADLIPDWKLGLSGPPAASYRERYGNLRALVAIKHVKQVGDYDEFQLLFMNVRNWTELTVADRVQLVRDLRSTTAIPARNAAGVFVHRSTGAISDTLMGKAKPGTYPLSPTDMMGNLLSTTITQLLEPTPSAAVTA
jgi:hypothetical protein